MKITEVFCDRCRRQIPDSSSISQIEAHWARTGDAPVVVRREICMTCAAQLIKFLDTNPETTTT
jgi:hypothetical protein